MSAFIVRPLEPDRVSNPVEIEVSFDFAAATNVVRKVDGDADAGIALNGAGNDVRSVNTTATGLQRVSIWDGADELNAQDNIFITVTKPVEIEHALMETAAGGTVVVKFKGKCAEATMPEHPFIACAIYSFNQNGVRTAVTIGFTVPDDKLKWDVILKFKPEPNKVYVGRAFLVEFQNPFTIIGATTKKLLP
jgi:hypothetical protein